MNSELLQDVVRQVLSEMKLQSSNILSNEYNYGIFDDMEAAINASETAQRKLLQMR